MTDTERSDEQFAGTAVSRATGARLIRYDIGGIQGAVDYLLEYADGRTGALEVTSVSDDQERTTYALLDTFNNSLPAVGACDWTITVTKRTNLRALQQIYGDVILLCEQLDLQTSQRIPLDLRSTQIGALLASGAKFRRIGSDTRDQSSQRPIYVNPAARGGAVHEDVRALPGELDAVLARTHVAHRLKKLSHRTEDERHLFTWFGPGGLSFPNDYAMSRGRGLPSDPPSCPDFLTHLWLTTAYSPALLGWCRDSGWRWYEVYDRK